MKDSARVISKPLASIMNEFTTKYLPQNWKLKSQELYLNLKVVKKLKWIIIVLSVFYWWFLKSWKGRFIHSSARFYQWKTFNVHFERPTLQNMHAVIALTDHIRRSMDQGMLTGSVFIDLRKAFDTVDHCLLMEKLCNYGVNDKELDWFSDYLQNREQVFQFGSAFSQHGSVFVRVPQGFILGLLFVLFINDLPNTTVRCNVLMYADDPVLFFSAKKVTLYLC